MVPFLGGIALTAVVVFLLRKKLFSGQYRRLEQQQQEWKRQADQELAAQRTKTNLELKEEFINWKNEYNRKQSQKINKINETERRLVQKEENLDHRYINLENKEKDLKKVEVQLGERGQQLDLARRELENTLEEQRKKLETISGLTVQEAKELIVSQYESEARMESAQRLRAIEEDLKEKSQVMAKDIIGTAIQRLASEHVVSSSVAVIDLPNDEMKGRIIGREGRNIRALENATGVDFIVDDTPEAIIVSSFDPIRREIAKRALETLIQDGRIHPARVEEIVEKIETGFDDFLREVGEQTVVELGIKDINPELYYYLGKLKFRTSYGQNALQHSQEVALIAAFMARELGANVNVARRAGLLHDVGKSIDRETEGTHTQLSVDLARKFGESKQVQEAIASHHMDVDFTAVEGVLIQAADTMSAARPGARREIFETYIKRLEKLEEVCAGFEGVEKAYALRAGREVRVIVDSNEMNDNKVFFVSKDIAKRIQEELEYPGQIKVTVIREVRAVEYAK
ncbi:MAG TPA: ribonuclease Y [Candidatus Aminicenantes bacterium]|nr:ribonuclease Y [Candidatus Aminicenantes bacterium]